jgi:hypothetical protein
MNQEYKQLYKEYRLMGLTPIESILRIHEEYILRE